jgi:hypothetical protein
LSGGSDYSFRVDNPDHDFDFVYYWDDDNTPDILLGFYATDHKNGIPNILDERFNSNDSLRARFTGVNTLGSQGNWRELPSPLDLDSWGLLGGFEVCSWGSTSLIVQAYGSC